MGIPATNPPSAAAFSHYPHPRILPTSWYFLESSHYRFMHFWSFWTISDWKTDHSFGRKIFLAIICLFLRGRYNRVIPSLGWWSSVLMLLMAPPYSSYLLFDMWKITVFIIPSAEKQQMFSVWHTIQTFPHGGWMTLTAVRLVDSSRIPSRHSANYFMP